MTRMLTAVSLILLTTDIAFAQSYCEQVRQGIDQYGYAAARRYAVEHYSPQEVRAADRCVARMRFAHYHGERHDR
ncbi:MAG TPA: hypothetical protein VKS78_05690 [Roseiarcus sp.]|nr:hypothetical protein [Roseiarcus sp.]